MIIYDLECGSHHRFEGWFKNANEFTEQQASGLVACPVCGSEEVRRIPSASHIAKSNTDRVMSHTDSFQEEATRHQVIKLFHDYINHHFDDVGAKFAEQAKKMHYGEIEERNIRGTATKDEIKELRDEGVATVQLPPAPYDKDKLN